MNVVYKILTLSEWKQALESGAFAGSTLDRRDGYIHLSTAAQVEETVTRHFSDSGVLVLVAVSVASLGAALRFEPSRGGELFPHAYKDLKARDFVWSRKFDSGRLEDFQRFIVE